MYPLYKLFKEGEQKIKPTVIKERSKAELKLKNLSFFIYYLNTFLQLLIITLLISKHETQFTIFDESDNKSNKNNSGNLNLLQPFSTNKIHNLLIFSFFECHIIIFGLLYRQFLFIKDQNFLLAKKFTIREYLLFVFIAMYSQTYNYISRPANLGTFFYYYSILFLLYNLFTEKEKNNMLSVNVISGLICLLLTSYCDNILSKIRIALICYNYLVLIPELLFYTQKIGENLWKIQIYLGVINTFLLSIMGVIELYHKKPSCIIDSRSLYGFDFDEKGRYLEKFSSCFSKYLEFYSFWGFSLAQLLKMWFVFYFLMFVVYPIIFNYYYKKYKERLIGKWDLPEVTNYY